MDAFRPTLPRLASLLLLAVLFPISWPQAFGENRNAALESITTEELRQHVTSLADDQLEGRLAGTRGGRAAGDLIVAQLQQSGIAPAGVQDSYFQPCGRGYRNILAYHHGSDPELANEVILVSGHYDHVGFGTPRNSFGPIGQVHNGADDNASGVSAILEIIEALQTGQIQTRRSLLFAFWDGEELGLIGSTHWARNPTLPLNRVKLMINLDMVGWLRDGKIEIYGTRSGYGLRRLMCQSVQPPLWLNFSWELQDTSDHWPFFQRGIPVTLVHTGLHDHYHRPSDDVERINHEGLKEVSRYLLEVLLHAASVDQLPKYRSEARGENPSMQRRRERAASPTPPRIGISWRLLPGESTRPEDAHTAEARLLVTRVNPGSPAARAGLQVGDQLVAVNRRPIQDLVEFQQNMQRAEGSITMTLVRGASTGTIGPDSEPPPPPAIDGPPPQRMDVEVHPVGPPVRLGISWRGDAAEPGSVYVTHVVPGSPASVAGLAVHDRIYEFDARSFKTLDEFRELVVSRLNAAAPQITMLVESRGYIRPVTIQFPQTQVAVSPGPAPVEAAQQVR